MNSFADRTTNSNSSSSHIFSSNSYSEVHKNGKRSPPVFRLCMVGSTASGKSCLLQRFIFKRFQQLDPTIEDHYETDYIFNEHLYHLSITDTSGLPEYYDRMHVNWFSNSDIYILVFNIHSKTQFKELVEFHKEILNVRKVEDVPMVFVGSQADNNEEESNEINQLDLEQFVGKHPFLTCSSLTGVNVQEVFEAAIVQGIKFIGTGQKHDFQLKYFAGPTWCKYCNKFIWGVTVKQGYYCGVCKYSCHKRCIAFVPYNCGSSRSGSITKPQHLNEEIRVSQFTKEEDLCELLNDQLSLENFRSWLESRSGGLQYLDLWLDCEQYSKKEAISERKEKALQILDRFFPMVNGHFLFSFSSSVLSSISGNSLKIDKAIIKRVKQKMKNEEYDNELFVNMQTAALKELKVTFFPDFVRAEFHRTFRKIEESQHKLLLESKELFSTPSSSSSLFMSALPSPLPSEQELSQEGSASHATDEEEFGGTFVITRNLADVDTSKSLSDVIAEISTVQERWEQNILALEKGEWSEDMSPLAFKKYMKTRARLPSLFICPIAQESTQNSTNHQHVSLSSSMTTISTTQINTSENTIT